MKSNVYNYEAQQLSMVLWALATTGHRSSPTAIVAAAASVESILPRFNPQVSLMSRQLVAAVRLFLFLEESQSPHSMPISMVELS